MYTIQWVVRYAADTVNKYDKGLGMTKETRGDTDATIILFLIPWYFSVKHQGKKEQYIIVPSVSPLAFFCHSLVIFIDLLVYIG